MTLGGPSESPEGLNDFVRPEPEVIVSVEIGWPRCKAVAQTTLEDGMLIAQVGIAASNIWGTQTAGIKAKEQALARLKLAIQVYRSQKENTISPIITAEG